MGAVTISGGSPETIYLDNGDFVAEAGWDDVTFDASIENGVMSWALFIRRDGAAITGNAANGDIGNTTLGHVSAAGRGATAQRMSASTVSAGAGYQGSFRATDGQIQLSAIAVDNTINDNDLISLGGSVVLGK